MDPFTITSTAIALSAKCLSTARVLYSLKEKYTSAQITISAIYSETTVISASLGHIQNLILRLPAATTPDLLNGPGPEVVGAFDTALTGCMLVYSILEDEVQKLIQRPDGVVSRGIYLWKEETMKDLLMQIRGQQTSLTLLIQTLQMGSVADMRILLQNNNAVLEQVVQRTKSLRQTYPRTRAPASIFDNTRDDTLSVYSFAGSTASSTDFEFDHAIINSQAYRRALAASRNSFNSASRIENDDAETNTIIGSEQQSATASIDLTEEIRQKTAQFDDLTQQHADLQTEHKELHSKYLKVKKFYFDREAESQALKKQLDETKVQITDLQTTQAWLHTEASSLRNVKELAVIRVQEMQDTVSRSHGLMLALDADVNAMRVDYEKSKAIQVEKVESLTSKLENSEGIRVLRDQALEDSQKALISAQNDSQQASTVAEYRLKIIDQKELEMQAMMQRYEAELARKEEELQRYRGLNSIIEQLRTLSPDSSMSTATSSTI